MKTILVCGTLDTKGNEVEFLRNTIKGLGARTIVLDGGVLGGPTFRPDITRQEVAAAIGMTMEEIQKIPAEAEALGCMTRGASLIAAELAEKNAFDGIIGIGGGMGTSIWTGVMRALPIGKPKFMVSSQASNPAVVGPAVGTTDIAMFHSVSDPVGLNRMTRTVFAQACGAIVGMASAEVKEEKQTGKKTIALCAKGTTEDANRALRQKIFDAGYQVMTFHCFGFGPASLEMILKIGGYIDGGVIELSNDWLDRIKGADSWPPDDRYENAGRLGLPQIFIPGSCDFFAASPGKYPDRKVHHHNAAVALYRSSREELYQVGRVVGEKLARSKGPVTVMVPTRGFCVHDHAAGGVLYDPDANDGFIEAVSSFNGSLKVKKIDAHVNDTQFVDAVMDEFLANAKLAGTV